MKKINLGFSLVEVMVASIVLTICVFGVYKLISENNKLLNNSNNFLDANLLIENTISCIENIGFDNFKNSNFISQTGSFYFESSLTGKCLTGVYNTSLSFTGININKKDYFLYGIINGTGSNFLDWEISISSSNVGNLIKKYREYK